MARGAGLLVCLVALALTGSALAQGKSYYQILKENPNHKFMIEMVDSVALYKNMLQNPPPGTPAMTIFAPVDAAFMKLLKEFNMTPDQAKKQAPAILTTVLFNHAVNKIMDKKAVDASTKTPIATMQKGQFLKVSRVPDPKDASKKQTWLQATGSKARIVKSNQYVTGLLGERKGVIHDVSDVLLPMSKAQLKARVVPVA